MLNAVSATLFAVCCLAVGVLVVRAPRRPRFAAIAFLVVAAFLLTPVLMRVAWRLGVVDQPDFLNAALALTVELPDDPAAAALEVLVRCKALERHFGRVASVRNGPRRLDLDIIALDDLAVIQPRPRGVDLDESGDENAMARPLVVPHPAAHE